MASQYDTIGERYNVFKTLPTSLVEYENLKEALLPVLARADATPVAVLDLACGTGYYSRKLLDWGASAVLGVDLSEGMVAAARQGPSDARLQFRAGNALDLGVVDVDGMASSSAAFDVVTGVWLLNYAADVDEMTRMFATVAANLKDGQHSVFVGVGPHPADDLDAFAEMTNEAEKEQPARWGVAVHYYERLASNEGWKTEVVGGGTNGTEEVRFRNYHLRKSVYEEAARRGGMKGRLTWKTIQIPPEAVKATGEAFWDDYFVKGPHVGILIVEKD